MPDPLSDNLRIIIFVILSIPVVIISWRTLFNIRSHGFFRFLSWECILWIFATNYRYWFNHPFSVRQIFSWVFLVSSGYLVIAGVIMLKRQGKPGKTRETETLYHFEQTTELIDHGIFKYIRHPLYSSLLFLSWGIFLKNPTWETSVVTFLSTLFLYLTAIFDEKECIEFFGKSYIDYMRRSKRFIPYIF